MSSTAAAVPQTAAISVALFNGARQPWPGAGDVLHTVLDGNHQIRLRQTYSSATLNLTDLPVFANAGDNYTVLASASGFHDAGSFPVKVHAGKTNAVQLLLLPKNGTVNFAGARWSNLPTEYQRVLASEPQYSDLFDYNNGLPAASLLNLFTSMSQIPLAGGTPLSYIRSLIYDRSGPRQLGQDRLFVWADPALIPALNQARDAGLFVDAPANLHPGATRSYKQVTFTEANLQLTFHENDRDSAGHVLLEPDIDYYRDALAHIFLEVLVNAFGTLTDPRQVMALRWMAAHQSGGPEFDPLYTVQSA